MIVQRYFAVIGFSLARASAASSASAATACPLSTLQDSAQKWNFLISTGDHSTFDNLSYDLTYTENDQKASILTGIAALALPITANRTYFDTTLCKFMTEHIVTDPLAPYVLETQIYVIGGIVSTIDMVVTRPNDFQFNATTYQTVAYGVQKWDRITPLSARDTREILQAAGDAYFAHLHDRSAFPVGTPCSILSGGSWTGRVNETQDSCTHKPKKPSDPTQTMVQRRYVIDEAYGVVNVFTRFGGLDRKRPNETVSDSHTFRVENGRVRYVNSASVCITPGCGWT